jgi:hypothetical protein
MERISSKIKEWLIAAKRGFNAIKTNRDLLVFLLFLLVATALWFLNALRKEYTTSIAYPVSYSDFPEDFILLGDPPKELQLKIKSVGFNILSYFIGQKPTAQQLNVSGFNRIQNGDKYGAFVLTRRLFKAISNNLNNGIELLEINPDTLFINFEKKERKKVPVSLHASLIYEPQFYQSGAIRIEPDSIEISGPSSLIDSTEYVNTEYSKFVGLNDSVIKSVVLQSIPNVNCNPKEVTVKIPIEAFTEKILHVPVKQLNVPDSLLLKSFPGEVYVSFMVAVSRFNSIVPDSIEAAIDFKSAPSGLLPDRLKVKLLSQPDGIKSVNYSPLFVECLFEKAGVND